MTSPVRPRGCGCLMLFSIFCLTVFTAAEIALLFRLNPDWFDRLAFWRGPILPPDVVLVENPAAKEALAREDAEWAAAHRAPPQTAVLLDDRAVDVDYKPGEAAVLTTKEDGVFEFPAGSIREACRVRAVPVASISERGPEDRMTVAGPCYKIYIGDQGHYQFARPMRAVLHYVPDLIPREIGTKGLAVYVQEEGGWKALPSTLDPQRHTLTADVPHCSYVVVGLGFGIAWIFSSHGQVTINSAWQGVSGYAGSFFDAEYKTKNFSIHYVARGNAAPPLDSGPNAFPKELKPNNPDPKHPNSVVLIGEILEFCHDHLQEVGAPIPDGFVFNHHVYLAPQEDLGLTPPGGGPVLLTSNWGDDKGRLPPADKLDALVRGTVAHELIHVAQAHMFGGAALRGRWWIEMTAEYLSEVFWEKHGKPTNLIASYYMANDRGKLPTLPINGELVANDLYRYARFLKWLERDGQDRVLRVVDSVNQGGDPSVEAFDRALQAEYHKPLGELLEAFAQDYYHYDARDRNILPPALYGNDNLQRPLTQTAVQVDPAKFTLVGRVPASGPASTAVGELNLWGRTDVRKLDHLTTQAFPVLMRLLPRDRKAKLVVKYEPPGAADRDVSLTWARAEMDSRSMPQTTAQFSQAVVESPTTSWVVSDLGAPGGNNLVSLLLCNRSTTRDLPGGALERWLLLAPAWAQSERESPPGTEHSRHWTVAWHRAELEANPQAFKGYNVYRRKWGDPDSALQLVKKEHPDDVWTDHAPDDEDYAYVVRVVDLLGNESADSPLDRTDPFQGLWEGEIELVEGSLVEPLLKAAEKAGEKADKEEQDSINKLADPAEKARRQQEWDQARKKGKEAYKEIADLLHTFEQLARLGLPLQVKIRMTEGKYYMSIPEFCWMQTGAGPKDEWEMKRIERNTLQLADMPKEAPPLELHLWRKTDNGQNEIHGGYELDVPTAEGKKEHCKFKWTLTRPPPAP